MREIKFRGWTGKEMIYFDDFKIEDTGAFWGGTREVWRMSANYGRGTCDGFGYFHDYFSQKSDVELMQFTGLLDKNGKEIYEGDIVKHFDHSEIVRDVIYMKGSFGYWTGEEFISYASNYHFGWQDLMKSDKIEIIGNIHEKSQESDVPNS